jgi:hypothetical protein
MLHGIVLALAATTDVGLREAIETATAARAGRAVEAELEGAVFEVAIVTDAHELFEVKVEAASGKLVSVAQEEDDDTAEEVAEFEKALKASKLGLAQLLAKGEAVVKGTAVKAVLEWDEEDGAECSVVFTNAAGRIEACVEARAGKLVDLALMDEDDDGDEDESGEEEDEDGEAVDDFGAKQAGALPSATPLKEGVRFAAEITHPYLPLSSVRFAEFGSKEEKVIREVQDATRKVAGVECLVLAEKEYEDGELAEISYNFFAQDAAGNVWYFGEDVDDYEDGEVVSHGGAWKVGRNAKEPCLFLPAKLAVGARFKPENSPPDAEEFDAIEAVDATLELPSGHRFRDVLVIAEGKKPGEIEERKYYVRGIGLVSENKELNLLKHRHGKAAHDDAARPHGDARTRTRSQ